MINKRNGLMAGLFTLVFILGIATSAMAGPISNTLTATFQVSFESEATVANFADLQAALLDEHVTDINLSADISLAQQLLNDTANKTCTIHGQNHIISAAPGASFTNNQAIALGVGNITVENITFQNIPTQTIIAAYKKGAQVTVIHLSNNTFTNGLPASLSYAYHQSGGVQATIQGNSFANFSGNNGEFASAAIYIGAGKASIGGTLAAEKNTLSGNNYAIAACQGAQIATDTVINTLPAASTAGKTLYSYNTITNSIAPTHGADVIILKPEAGHSWYLRHNQQVWIEDELVVPVTLTWNITDDDQATEGIQVQSRVGQNKAFTVTVTVNENAVDLSSVTLVLAWTTPEGTPVAESITVTGNTAYGPMTAGSTTPHDFTASFANPGTYNLSVYAKVNPVNQMGEERGKNVFCISQ